jgi:toxin HigB-1
MIVRFRHKGLERLFASGDTRGVSAQHVKRLQWAVSVSGNWRLVFRFDGENATDVDLVDYH